MPKLSWISAEKYPNYLDLNLKFVINGIIAVKGISVMIFSHLLRQTGLPIKDDL